MCSGLTIVTYKKDMREREDRRDSAQPELLLNHWLTEEGRSHLGMVAIRATVVFKDLSILTALRIKSLCIIHSFAEPVFLAFLMLSLKRLN